MQRDRTPDARDIIALTKAPNVWQVADNRVLVGHTMPPGVDWPDPWGSPAAWQVLDRHGRVLGQWAQQATYEYVPAGRYFVGLQPSYSTVPEPLGDASRALLVRRGTPTALTLLPDNAA